MDVRLRSWLAIVLLLVGSKLTACQDDETDDDGSTSGEPPTIRSRTFDVDPPKTCEADTCSSNGACRTETYEDGTIAVCTCEDGFSGAYCDQPDPRSFYHACVPSPCRNGGTCRVDRYRSAGYICQCPPGFSGDTCVQRSGGGGSVNPGCSVCKPGEICQMVGNQALCSPGHHPCVPSPCLNGGECRVVQGGSYQCRCQTGYAGLNCGTRTGGTICNVGNCIHGTCATSSYCRCNPGWQGVHCNSQVRSGCLVIPCLNNGRCSTDGFGVSSCICTYPFSGTRCEVRSGVTNPCLPRSPCQNGGICNPVGSPLCRCISGFTGTHCHIAPVNPCYPNPCLNAAQCTISGGSFICICKTGTRGPRCGETIRAPDPCNPNPCHGHPCFPASFPSFGFRCVCNGGHSGLTCQIHRCSPNPCHNSGHCDTHTGTCSCVNGFSGNVCQIPPRNRCLPNPCLNNGICDNLSGTCTCVNGYSGTICQLPPNRCNPNPCLNGGICNSLSGACTCVNGYSGTICQLPPNRCNPNPCLNGGICDSLSGTCACVNGYSGTICQLPDPCRQNPCHNGGICTSLSGTAHCTCVNGYQGQFCTVPPHPRPEPSQCNPNPCLNGGTCTPYSTAFTCGCASGYIGHTCATRDTRSAACSPNPCLNGCECVPSCRHSNAYYCKGTNGLLGKNCQLPAPTIVCGPNSISISIDARVINEYDSGIGGFTMFMSQSSSLAQTPTCPAQNAGGSYTLVLPLPFSACGSSVVTGAGGKTVVSNYVWLNKLIANGVADMPVPILHFTCSYAEQYNVITSLKPGVGLPPTIVSRGSKTDTASIELCKSKAFCPAICPPMFLLSQGATYTVGEMLNLRITLPNLANQFRILDLFLSCRADPSATWTNAPIVLLANGCMATSYGKYLPVTVKPTGTGTCASFPVPLMKGCADFFIHARLQPCSAGTCLAAYAPCVGRRKRSEESLEIDVEELDKEKSATSEVFGPIVVIEGEEGVIVAKVLYPGEDFINSTETGVLVLKEDPKQTATISSTLLPLKVALGVLLVLAVALLAMLVYFNWRYLNAHCGRKV